MKETIKNLFVYVLIFFLVLSMFTGIVLPENIAYLLATLAILSLAMMIAKPFLTFLTIKVNFVTLFLVGSLLIFGCMFLLESLMTGFTIENEMFTGVTFGSIVIKDFEMVPIVSMAGVAIVGSLMCSLFHELDKN
jgi:uncharacterized membrane protein YvlD (DUF360 family)